MNGRRLTDAQIAQALRTHLPAQAQPGLRSRTLGAIDDSAQLRPLPPGLSRLAAAEHPDRVRVLLLAATVALALLAMVAAAGAIRRPAPTLPDELSVAPPGPSLTPSADVNAYVVGAYEGLVHLPALAFTVTDAEGTKERYAYDGAGTVRADHYDNDQAARPSSYRILSADRMAERLDVGGRDVWVTYSGQGKPLLELVYATGLTTDCDADWSEAGIEYVLGRPTRHVACGSELWIDVETGLPLRAIVYQSNGPTRRLDVLEMQVGPQPASLFAPPTGLVAMTGQEYECAMDPRCPSPPPSAPSASPRPIPIPPPAPGDVPVPPDIDAFVAEALARYPAMPAYDMTTSVVDAEGESSSVRLMHDGAGRYRSDRSYAGGRPLNIVIADGRHMYESWGPDAAGTVLWVDQGPRSTDAMFPTMGLHQHCLLGWKHRGVDLVAGRPAHHLSCGHADYWIDNDWKIVVRWQSNPDPLNVGTHLEELVSLVFARPDADRFELPAGAVVCPGRIRDGKCMT